jgi:hypothetical protein
VNSVTLRRLGVALTAIVLASACNRHEQAVFGKLYASDFGLEIHFSQTPAQVQEVLGPPSSELEVQGGLSLTYYYLPPEETNTGVDTPQLALTFLHGKLARIYNRSLPDDPEQPPPPYVVEPLTGARLGSRKSSFVAALGPPTNPITGNEWKFRARDGRTILLTTAYASPPGRDDPLCSVLHIVLAPSIEEARGEEIEQGDWREKVGL